VILVDANLLLHAYNRSAASHAAARRWLEEVFSKPAPVCFAWAVILAFLRITTHPRVFPRPLAAEEALEIVGDWLQRPNTSILVPTSRHWEILQNLVAQAQATGPLVMDAHLASLALEHGATLCTTDRDFARFPGLKMMNPLRPDRS
jgi:toxin-antitoxin system PIN domain toxin